MPIRQSSGILDTSGADVYLIRDMNNSKPESKTCAFHDKWVQRGLNPIPGHHLLSCDLLHRSTSTPSLGCQMKAFTPYRPSDRGLPRR